MIVIVMKAAIRINGGWFSESKQALVVTILQYDEEDAGCKDLVRVLVNSSSSALVGIAQ
jgi:hypothetical protein